MDNEQGEEGGSGGCLILIIITLVSAYVFFV